MIKKRPEIQRLETGVRNLDDLLQGGLPAGSVTVLAGSPGAGKTVLAEQICFHNASPTSPVLYFSTLSEPTAKTLRYLTQFSFFDPAKMDDGSVQFTDLGVILRTKGLEDASRLVMEQVRKVRPAIIVIDSFRVFDDLSPSREQLRKFGYELAVQMMAWEATVFLVGEFGPKDIESNSLFSIVDGLIVLTQREQAGEQQRFIQVVKMRGTEHSRDEHSFVIRESGIEVYAPRVTIQREDIGINQPRLKTGIHKFDDLLGEGISRGSSLLIAGVSGTGKTILLLEFLYRGALAGEKGILFSFEETEERLRSNARSLGWELDEQIERGMVEIIFIPQPNILVEAHLLMMRERIGAMQARRVAVDSVSVFLHKVKDAQLTREKVFQLASIIQNTQAVGFLATDIRYGASEISRFGVEETVVDGVFVLSSTQQGLERHRYIEIYKLRNTAHLKGRHSMVLGQGGITIFPRYGTDPAADPKQAVKSPRRIPSGLTGLDPLLGGGLLERSVTLVSGSAGIGKSTLATQFILEGAKRREPGIYVTLEEGMGEVVSAAKRLELPLDRAIEDGLAEVLYLSREHAMASQFLSLLVDRIRALKARRLVLDSLTHLVPNGLDEEGLPQLLFALVGRFKTLGVTSLFTMESTSMFSREKITDCAFSPIADNLIVLRYADLPGGIRPTLTIVKTRGSRHDFGTYYYDFGAGGIHLGPHADGADAERAAETPRAERPDDDPAKPGRQPRARRKRPRR